MIKVKLLKQLTNLAIGLFVSFSSYAEFSFAYRTTGEPQLKPVQVFDDGSQTYLQMESDIVPVVIANVNGKQTMLAVRRSAQYLVIPAIAKEFTLKYSTLTSKVIYSGGQRSGTLLLRGAILDVSPEIEEPTGDLKKSNARLPKPVYAAVKPMLGEDNFPTFSQREIQISFPKGKDTLTNASSEKILKALATNGEIFEVIITGRDDQYYVEGLAKSRAIAMRDRVQAAGIPQDRIIIKEGVALSHASGSIHSDINIIWKNKKPQIYQTAYDKKSWDMRAGDKSISNMIKRWASDQGYEVIWLNAEDVVINGDKMIPATSLADAIRAVISSANSVGYKFNVEYTGKTIVIK